MNSLVLSDEQRAAATDPVVRRLIELIPRANFVDADGTPRFVGSATAAVDTDRWTIDFRQNVGRNDRVPRVLRRSADHVDRAELARHDASPGSACGARNRRSILTINDTHVFGPALFNEARFGRSALASLNTPLRRAQSGRLRHPERRRCARSGCRRCSWPAVSTSAGRRTFRTDGMTRRTSSPTRSATCAAGTRSNSAASTGTSSTRTSTKAPGLQLPERRGVPRRNRQRVQHHARRTTEPHRPARRGAVLSGQRHGPAQSHARARTALRVARHAHRTGQSVRRLRRRQCVAVASRRRRRRDLPAEQPEFRAARRRGLGRVAGRPHGACAPPMRGRSTSRARRRSGTPRPTRHSRRRWRRRARFRSPAPHARRSPAGLAPATVDPAVPERLAAIVERERAAAARPATSRR